MSSNATHAGPAGNRGGGAFGLRPRDRVLIAAAILVAAIVLAIVLLAGHGRSHRTVAASNNETHYGGYPSWLPHTKLPATNTPLQSTAAHRQLKAIEGNPIEAQLTGGGEAEITAIGPSIPNWVSSEAQAGTLTEGSPVPASFSVTVIARHGTVPIDASAFSIMTSGGELVHPAVTAPGMKAAPRTLRAG